MHNLLSRANQQAVMNQALIYKKHQSVNPFQMNLSFTAHHRQWFCKPPRKNGLFLLCVNRLFIYLGMYSELSTALVSSFPRRSEDPASTASGSSSYQHKRLHFCVVDVYLSVHLCRRLVVGQQRRRLRGSLFVVIVFHCYYSRRRRRRRHPHFQSSLKGRWYWWQ